MKVFVIVLLCIAICLKMEAQTLPAQANTILTNLSGRISAADGSGLLTDVGLNVLLQKRALNYLTGVSDLSLAKFYGTYSTENDKLNLGFNIPAGSPYTQKIYFIINPVIEADVKSNFATLYKDDKWKNNIRVGLKITWLPGRGTINYINNNAVQSLKILRTTKYNEFNTKLLSAYSVTPVNLISGGAAVTPPGPAMTNKKWSTREKELNEELGKAEAEYVDKEGAYVWLQNYWLSVWAFAPLTKTEQFVTPDISQPFTKVKFNLWEFNVQGTYLLDYRKAGSVYASAWLKMFQNNSANASLMTNVDYHQYSQLPGTNPLNFALLETNKGYIGSYDEFNTTNLNLQVVYFAPFHNTLIKPGISVRYEKNWGQYSPVNWRFGLPLTINGKDKPVNIELQYRVNDVNNYMKAIDHTSSKTLGLSLGFPVVLLYK